MSTIQDASGLPRDRYVNTIYVNTITPFPDAEAALLEINDIMASFYIASQGLFSAQVAGNTHTVKAYDMSLPPGLREPMGIKTFTLANGGQPLPGEVALVLTLEATPQAGVAPMSTRGRVFLGPLGINTVATPSAGQGSRPAPTALTGFVHNMALTIQAINDVGPATVCIASTRQDKADLAVGSRFAYPVINVSADNAWDTQRSRGNRANVREREEVSTPPGLPRTW